MLEPTTYILNDSRWGKTCDLSGADNRSIIAFSYHGRENQQWEFIRFGDGYAIRNVRSQSYLSVDLAMFSCNGSSPAIVTPFLMCWEIEVQKSAKEVTSDDEDKDVLIRIRWPGTGYMLGLSNPTEHTKVCLSKDTGSSTIWLASLYPRPKVTSSPPMKTEDTTTRFDTHMGRKTVTTTTTLITTTTKTVTRIASTEA